MQLELRAGLHTGSYLPLREELFLSISLPSVFISTAHYGISRTIHPDFSSGTAWPATTFV